MQAAMQHVPRVVTDFLGSVAALHGFEGGDPHIFISRLYAYSDFAGRCKNGMAIGGDKTEGNESPWVHETPERCLCRVETRQRDPCGEGAGLPLPVVTNALSGVGDLPDLSDVKRLADTLHVHAQWLTRGDIPMVPLWEMNDCRRTAQGTKRTGLRGFARLRDCGTWAVVHR